MPETIRREQIVDAALELAQAHGWEAVRLHDIATHLSTGLDDIRTHVREKEDIVDAWFDRADAAMLQAAEMSELAELSTRERLRRLMMAWLGALAPQRRVTRQMILNKLEPGHLHVQIPGLLRVSRTVQWWREAAQRDATYICRALEETALTSIYLMTFVYWMSDDSIDSGRTAQFLDGHLRRAESFVSWLPGTPVRTATADAGRDI